MNRFLRHLGLAVAVLAILAPVKAKAELIVPGVTDFPIAAIQNVELLPGTPFNPYDFAITITNLTAVGTFSINRAARLAQRSTTRGSTRSSPRQAHRSAPWKLGAGPTIGIGGFSGSITSVAQDPSDPGYGTGQPSSFSSGEFLANVTQFGLRVSGQLLFTKDPVLFTGHIDGLPPSDGTTLWSPDPVAVYWTNPADGIDLLIAYSFDRRLVSVPEPSSLTILSIGLAGLGLRGKRQRVRS